MIRTDGKPTIAWGPLPLPIPSPGAEQDNAGDDLDLDEEPDVAAFAQPVIG